MNRNFIKTKKGFTLIELLAVITILAVLVLVAIPAVTGLMNKSIMGAFRTDALSMAQSGIQTAYSNKILNGAVTTDATKGVEDTIYRNNGTDYLCMGLDKLVSENYVTKNDYTSYGGYLQIKVTSDGTTTIAFNLTDGKYYIKTTYKQLSKSGDVTETVLDTQPTGGANVGYYTCPTGETMAAND